MIKFIKSIFQDEIEYISDDYFDGKTDEQLVEKLKSGKLSYNSGAMIVNELLERLVKSKNKT